MEPETAGNPTTDQKWGRASLRHLSERRQPAGHSASPPTLSRWLKTPRYALKVKVKQKDAGALPPQGDEQLRYIETPQQAFQAAGHPILSGDTKKKELIGECKNSGQAWCQQPGSVLTHDVPQYALGRAVPDGLYALRHNVGFVYVGCWADTPQFGVDAIARWWGQHGPTAFPQADQGWFWQMVGAVTGSVLVPGRFRGKRS